MQSTGNCRHDVDRRFSEKLRAILQQFFTRTKSPGGADAEHPGIAGGFHIDIAVPDKHDFAWRQAYGRCNVQSS